MRNSLIAACGLSLLVNSAQAADGTWTQLTSGGLWSDSANWSGGVIADGSGSTANFNTLNLTADNTVNLDSDRTLTNLIFGDTTPSTAGGWILSNNAVSTNNLILAGTTPTITVNTLGTAKNANITALIEGTAGLIKDGVGQLNIGGGGATNNSFTGGLTIRAGTVFLNPGSGTMGGAGSITIGANVGDASLILGGNGGAGVTYANPIILGGGTGVLTLSTESTNISLTGGVTGTGDLVIKEGRPIGPAAGNMNFNTAVLNNVGSITNKTHTGVVVNTLTINSGIGSNVTALVQDSTTARLALSGANIAFIGDTTVTAGTLSLQNTNSLQKSVLNMNGGTVTFGTSTTVAITSVALGGLSGSGNINLNNTLTVPTAVNLTIGNSNASYGGNTLNPTYSGVLSNANGAASLTKVGNNTQTLSGSNTYTGSTTVSEGTLLIASGGSIAVGSEVTVQSGAAIGGDGLINGNLTLNSDAKFVFDLNDNPLTVGGTFALSSTFGVDDLVTSSGSAIDWSFVSTGTYTLIDTSFVFNEGNIENFGLGNAFFSGGKQMYFANGSMVLVVVPEPAAWMLLAFGLTTVMLLGRRRHLA